MPTSAVSPTGSPWLTAAFAVLGYVAFLTSLAWAFAFLVGLPAPTGVDRGPHTTPWAAGLIDLGLLAAFALHHSVLARTRVKRTLARVVPASAERSLYVLVASALLMTVLALWRPIPAVVWDVSWQPGRTLVWVTYVVGWVLTVSASFLVDHREFTGLRQAGVGGRRPGPGGLSERGLYAVVRHPMMLGLVVVVLAAPTLTAGHLLFAVASIGYIVVGVRLEERDLNRNLGPAYADYATRVPALIPGVHRLDPRRLRGRSR